MVDAWPDTCLTRIRHVVQAFVPVLALFISCQRASPEQEASTETPQIVQASALEIEEADLKAKIAGLEDMMESCRGLDPDLVSDSLRQSCIYLLTTGLFLYARLEEVSRAITDSVGTSLADSIDATLRDLGLNSEMPAEPSVWTKEEEPHIDSVMCYAVVGGLTADVFRQAYPDCQRYGLPIFKQEGIYRR